MLGWHVRSRPPALWCSQIVVPYICAGRHVCSPGSQCCKICCWCHHTGPPYIDCLVMMPCGTIADSPSWATGLTGMYHTMGLWQHIRCDMGMGNTVIMWSWVCSGMGMGLEFSLFSRNQWSTKE